MTITAISLGSFWWSILPVVVLVVSFFAWRLILARVRKRGPEQYDRLAKIGLLIAALVFVVAYGYMFIMV